MKQNCWEFNKCGREPNGSNVKELGVCRVSIDTRSDGINNGVNGGRICWTINGTLCNKSPYGDKIKPMYATLASCLSCSFFKKVKHEEGPGNFKTLKKGTVYELQRIIIKSDENN